ncbi:type II secretion system F family protein [Fodinisporobacter ferrooxydans]|uniref:Type II secretion system F family protein n=1 Tax=Fodinisporobacter ferrooxydans TaxID=2901836 RepID=A0ABY4CLB1_9BACL|nr:type II secretion system F family protein [Alicyclobacillaceae bacterium MYW30-H2]
MEYSVFAVFSFLSLTCFFAGILTMVRQPRMAIQQRIERLFTKDHGMLEQTPSENDAVKRNQSFRERVLYPVWTWIRNRFKKYMRAKTVSSLEKKLREAGQPFGLTPIDYRVIQCLIGGSFFLLIFLLLLSIGAAIPRALLFSVIAGCFGLLYPNLYLDSKKRQRLMTIQKTMPDFFDMVNVSVEAGLGIDQALWKVSKQLGGPLAWEFLQTLDEMRLGKSRREAFSHLSNRIPMDSFQSVMSALIQADQLGIGMAKVIRIQTRRIREHQRQLARERAMKAPIKMMFPLVMFIFPTLFIVLLGPIVILLMKNFF